MIYAFTGKTGSGKTFHMIKFAYKEWLRGVDIYSNTVLLFESRRLPVWHKIKHWLRYTFIYIARREYTPPARGRIIHFEDISEILEAKNGVILFDEAQVLFNARSWESLPKEFQYKLQQHRKHRLDLYCTTQNMGAIDITYRRLVQFWFHHDVSFAIGENPVWFGIFRSANKDIDMLYNSVDDLQVPTLKRHLFIIWRGSRRLYDTMYDIGFRRFKSIWLTQYNSKTHKTEELAMIIPKEMSLQNARTQLLLYKFLCGLNKSKYSNRN